LFSKLLFLVVLERPSLSFLCVLLTNNILLILFIATDWFGFYCVPIPSQVTRCRERLL
jgi:hypothetical protein